MKKVIIISAVSIFALASCKKDYTCECTISGTTTTYEYTDVKKSSAETSCDALGGTAALAGGSCEIK